MQRHDREVDPLTVHFSVVRTFLFAVFLAAWFLKNTGRRVAFDTAACCSPQNIANVPLGSEKATEFMKRFRHNSHALRRDSSECDEGISVNEPQFP